MTGGPGKQVPGISKTPIRRTEPASIFGRYASDFDLLRSLNQNAHRLSVEWSRIEPAPGEFSRTALAHYRDVFAGATRPRHEPMVTLHHFTNPNWNRAGRRLGCPQDVGVFCAFLRPASRTSWDLARYWITVNEPTVIAYQGYVRGEWPPGTRNLGAAARVLVNLLRAHWLAYERIKSRHPQVQIGLAHHLRVFDPARRFMPQDRARRRSVRPCLQRDHAEVITTRPSGFSTDTGRPRQRAHSTARILLA